MTVTNPISTVAPDLMMSKSEAIRKHAQLKNLHEVVCGLFLEMRDREGYKALGYDTFADYGKIEWGYSSSQTYRIAKAAEIALTVNSPLGELSETQLRPLSKIPPDQRQTVLDNAIASIEQNGSKLTAQVIREHVEEHQQRTKQAEQQLAETQSQISELAEQAARQKIEEKTKQIQEHLQANVETLVANVEKDYQAHLDAKDDQIMRLKAELNNLAENETTAMQAEKQRLLEEISQVLDLREKVQTENHINLIVLGLRSVTNTAKAEHDALVNLICNIERQSNEDISQALSDALIAVENLRYYLTHSIDKFKAG
ncbi:MAG: hypothetical protein Q7U57_09575 [Methylovulum sp.]|nr:hypothetical protein [Methylovulum sp.]